MTKKKRASSKEIARLAGVSQATVSYVLNNKTNVKISTDTRDRVLEIARRLNYQPDYFAQTMRLKQTKFIGVVAVKDIAFRGFNLVLNGIRNVTPELGYHIIICEGYDETKDVKDFIDLHFKNVICGVIFISAPWLKNHPFLEDLMNYKVPFVIIGGVNPESPKFHKINLVKMNFYHDAYSATEYMVQKGITDITYFRPTEMISTENDRLQGYVDACGSYSVKEEIIDFKEFVDKKERLLKSILGRNKNTKGIITAFDIMSYEIIHTLLLMGVKIPKEVSLIACDDIFYSDYSYPRLTTINLPNEKAGEEATRMLVSHLKDPAKFSQTIIEGQLAIRETCI